MLGLKVREFRKSHHLTLSALAAELGISDSYLSQLESGRIDPSISLVRKIAAVFQVPIAALFDSEYEVPIVTCRCDREVIELAQGSAVVSRLTPRSEQVLLDMREFELQADTVLSLNPHAFHTCLHLTAGAVLVCFSDIKAELAEGDSIFLPPNTRVDLKNTCSVPCKGFLCTRETDKGGIL